MTFYFFYSFPLFIKMNIMNISKCKCCNKIDDIDYINDAMNTIEMNMQDGKDTTGLTKEICEKCEHDNCLNSKCKCSKYVYNHICLYCIMKYECNGSRNDFDKILDKDNHYAMLSINEMVLLVMKLGRSDYNDNEPMYQIISYNFMYEVYKMAYESEEMAYNLKKLKEKPKIHYRQTKEDRQHSYFNHCT